jgi:two-component system chemotaxis sensor kinase CheA
MDPKDLEFLRRLKATFRIEAEEHIQTISAGLSELEKAPTPERGAELVETIFRESHSLKGAARSVSLGHIESLCQPLEGVFFALKRGSIAMSPRLGDLLQRSVDSIARIVSSPDMEGSVADRAVVRELVRRLEEEAAGASPALDSAKNQVPLRPATEERPAAAGTVRISMERLDALLLQAEEMIAVKMAVGQRATDLRDIGRALEDWKSEATRWKRQEPMTGAPRWKEWREWNEARLEALETRVAAVARALDQDERSTRRMIDGHLEDMKRIAMLPVASLVEPFRKIVRDLARDQGKDVELVIRGAELEVDKRILEEMKDPLVHLLRNCIDHGMQAPEERIAENKRGRGTITLDFSAKDGRHVEIVVADDGTGIDPAQVRAAAGKSGIVSMEEAHRLDPKEALALIFRSGLSTSPIITTVSGRGLGLAIVLEKAEKLGGSVSVDTEPHAGTTFRLLLPLTLATFRGVLVRADDQVFVLPAISVERVAKVYQEKIKTVENREAMLVDGQFLSIVRLADALGLPSRARQAPTANTAPGTDSAPFPVVVLASAGRRIAFRVDEILDERPVMLKGLGRQLERVRNVAGAAILGSGRVVPVLNASDLMKSAIQAATRARPSAEAPSPPSRKARILVAEDSITSRVLLKNILETAGYGVTVAVDGAEAFAKAGGGKFDLVVSDVDMPRMSGFELTAKIRGDRRLSDLPVVLVTALESREDRERGIDAGADAYIVKSSFDQSDLLDIVRRLL